MSIIQNALILEFNIEKSNRLLLVATCLGMGINSDDIEDALPANIKLAYEYNLVLNNSYGFFIVVNNVCSHFIIRDRSIHQFADLSSCKEEEIINTIFKMSSHLKIRPSIPRLHRLKNNWHKFSCVSAIICPVENRYPTDYYIICDNGRIDIKHFQKSMFGPYHYQAWYGSKKIPYMRSSVFKKLINKLHNKHHIPKIMNIEETREKIVNIIKK